MVRTTSATAQQALMLLTSCGFPCDVSVPSFSSMICGCSIEDMVEDGDGGGRERVIRV